MKDQVEAYRAQLADATAGAAGLQELLAAQQAVAESYRREANRAIMRLSELEHTSQQTGGLEEILKSYKEQEEMKRTALAEQLKQQQAQIAATVQQQTLQRSFSIEDVHKGLDELRGELKNAREREELQQAQLTAARLVVT